MADTRRCGRSEIRELERRGVRKFPVELARARVGVTRKKWGFEGCKERRNDARDAETRSDAMVGTGAEQKEAGRRGWRRRPIFACGLENAACYGHRLPLSGAIVCLLARRASLVRNDAVVNSKGARCEALEDERKESRASGRIWKIWGAPHKTYLLRRACAISLACRLCWSMERFLCGM